MVKQTPNVNRSEASLGSLIFEDYKGAIPGSPTTLNITDTNGTVIKKLYTTQTDSTYDISNYNRSYSKGLLASDEIYTTGEPVSVTKWSLIKSDGSSLPISPLLLSKLNSTWDLSKINNLSHVFVTSDNTIVALVHPNLDDVDTFRYSQFDLTTGKEKTLITIFSASPIYYPQFIPENVNLSGNTISFLVSDVIINSQTVHGTGVALYNLSSSSLTIQTLPSNLLSLAQSKRTNPYVGGIPPIGISTDGNSVVYQSPYFATNSDSHTQLWTTHLYNIPLRKDIIIPTKITLPGGYKSYFFSPNNKYLVFYFENTMDIARVSDGKVVQSFTLGSDPNNPNPSEYLYNIQPIGWIDNQTLAYVTQKSDVPGINNFNGKSISHTINVTTHQIHDYPSTLGGLAAIIYK